MKISDLHQFLLSNDNFILTTHENPDGDGLGSMIALGHYLRSLGKKVRLVATRIVTGKLRGSTIGIASLTDKQLKTPPKNLA